MEERQKIRRKEDLIPFKLENIQLLNETYQMALEHYKPKAPIQAEPQRIKEIDENSNHPGSYLVPLNQYHNSNIYWPECLILRPQLVPREYVNYDLSSKCIPVYYSPSPQAEQDYYPLGGYYQPNKIRNKFKKPAYDNELSIIKPYINRTIYKKII